MRLLFIPSWFPSSKDLYAGSFIKHLAMDLAEQGVEIVVLNFAFSYKTSSSEVQTEFISENLTVYHFFGFQLPKANVTLQNRWTKRCFSAFQNLQLDESFDAVHSHDYVASFIGHHFASNFQKPHISTLHHSDFIEDSIPAWRVRLLKEVLASCQAILVPSRALRDSVESKYEVEVKVIPHYINWEFVAKEKLPEIPLRAIAVTSEEEVKNNKGLIEFCKVHSINIDVYGGIEKELTKELTSEIRHRGKMSHKELLKRYFDYDFFISFSNVETFGIAALEAMSMGLPCLIKNKYGARDLITSETGMFIEDSDSYLEFTKYYRSYVPSVISSEVSQKFAKEDSLNSYLNIYESLLN